ncbi:TetR/AcrR family transcriptional regulator [Caballeronia sp. INML2]|jgi:AcrR family transcriptional regulator|uniref:TetR/AcrR family transcriptional regulator n=1 Tax=Caballeronia sp. INML2 TaxID=2921748 RepID=UPI0020298F21|nr:TetR/AcrR family transcriptional regulator [Caballeronia sp. INML2]
MTKDQTTHARAHGDSAGRKRLGRPAGNVNQRENILDAAEVDFSQRGYAGTSLKEVAASCGVTQALITYYFGTKQQLFEQVFLRRATLVSEERVNLLRALGDGGAKPDVRDIVRAFLQPLVALRQSDGGRAFIRLQARLHTEPPEISYSLRSTAYGDSTDAYVEALRTALPGLPEKDLYWRVTAMIGAYLYAFSDTHRLDMLAKGACDPWDANETLEQLTSFIVGGLEAQASVATKPAKTSRAKKTAGAPAKKTVKAAKTARAPRAA